MAHTSQYRPQVLDYARARPVYEAVVGGAPRLTPSPDSTPCRSRSPRICAAGRGPFCSGRGAGGPNCSMPWAGCWRNRSGRPYPTKRRPPRACAPARNRAATGPAGCSAPNADRSPRPAHRPRSRSRSSSPTRPCATWWSPGSCSAAGRWFPTCSPRAAPTPPSHLLDAGRLRAGPEPREVTLAEAYCTAGCCGALYATAARARPDTVASGGGPAPSRAAAAGVHGRDRRRVRRGSVIGYAPSSCRGRTRSTMPGTAPVTSTSRMVSGRR
ncbi:hypothetical protein SAVIM40S_00453 [Streptomyces avidinii]